MRKERGLIVASIAMELHCGLDSISATPLVCRVFEPEFRLNWFMLTDSVGKMSEPLLRNECQESDLR